MGCDIHMIVQRKQTYDGGSYWSTQLPPAWWPREEWKAKWIAELTAKLPDAGSAQTLARQLSYWYDGRNYDLFGILADVRNGSGFAGIKTLDTGWPSIAPNRGLPEGLDKDLDETGWLGDHSFTWMTLAEVLAYPWETTTRTQRGVVTLEQFLARDPNATGFPYEEWSGDAWSAGAMTMTAADVRAQLAAGEDVNHDGVRLYVRDTWPITAAHVARYFYETTLPALVRQAEEWGVSHDDIRLVMGFDS